MVRFRVAEAPARGEYLVEAYVPSEGNDAALIAVFNSEGAASKFAEFFNVLDDIASFVDTAALRSKLAAERELKHGDD